MKVGPRPVPQAYINIEDPRFVVGNLNNDVLPSKFLVDQLLRQLP